MKAINLVRGLKSKYDTVSEKKNTEAFKRRSLDLSTVFRLKIITSLYLNHTAKELFTYTSYR